MDESSELEREPTPPPKAPEPPAAPRGAGVSLWHKIFGSPEQQSQKIVESAAEPEAPSESTTPRHREDRHANERYGEDRYGDQRHERHRDESRRDRDARQPARSDLGPTPDDVFIDSPDPSLVGDVEDRGDRSSTEGDDQQKPRPRRRRGGRGRRRSSEDSAEPRAEKARDDVASRNDEEGEAPRRDDRPRQRSDRDRGPRRNTQRRPSSARQDKVVRDDNPHEDDFDDFLDLGPDDEQAGDATLDTEGDDVDSAGRSLPAGHRSIPSWDEAIGIIVDVNLQTRTDRRGRSPNSGPPRGRSRGGRRRNN